MAYKPYTEWHVPIALIVHCISERKLQELKLYLWLKACSSGKIKLDDYQIQSVSLILDVTTYRTKSSLNKLNSYNWLGYNPKSKYYFIRSFDKVRIMEQLKQRRSAVFCLNDLKNFPAWCGGAFYAYLYKLRKGANYKHDFLKGKSKQAYNAPSFLPVATAGVERIFQLSRATATRYKLLAKRAGYLEVEHRFKKLGVPKSEIKYFREGVPSWYNQKLVLIKGELYEQLPDVVLPHISLSKRKSL